MFGWDDRTILIFSYHAIESYSVCNRPFHPNIFKNLFVWMGVAGRRWVLTAPSTAGVRSSPSLPERRRRISPTTRHFLLPLATVHRQVDGPVPNPILLADFKSEWVLLLWCCVCRRRPLARNGSRAVVIACSMHPAFPESSLPSPSRKKASSEPVLRRAPRAPPAQVVQSYRDEVDPKAQGDAPFMLRHGHRHYCEYCTNNKARV